MRGEIDRRGRRFLQYVGGVCRRGCRFLQYAGKWTVEDADPYNTWVGRDIGNAVFCNARGNGPSRTVQCSMIVYR